MARPSSQPAGETVSVIRPVGRLFTFVLLQWSNHGGDPNWSCKERSLPIAALEVQTAMTPDWIGLEFGDARPTFCLDPAETIFVETIAPPPPASAHPEPIFAARIVAPANARRGEQMRYLVQLTNRTDTAQRFTECPVYVQSVAGPQELGSGDALGFRSIERRQILNCAGVGSITSGATLTFEMYFDIPLDVLPGTYVLPWRLDGPVYSTGYKVSLRLQS